MLHLTGTGSSSSSSIPTFEIDKSAQSSNNNNVDNSTETYELQKMILNAIKELKKIREANLKKLPDVANALNNVEQCLPEMLKLTTQRALVAFEQSASDDDSLDEKIDELEDKIKQIFNKIIVDNPVLEIDNSWFSDLFLVDRQLKINDIDLKNQSALNEKITFHLNSMQEQLLNRIVNKAFYLMELNKTIEANKKLIFSEFYAEDSSQLDLSKVSFELMPFGSETHNRGKVATLVIFKLNDNELFRTVFKPRDSQIDQYIISVFDKINKLDASDKSSDVKLPTYKIINIQDQTFNQCSFWQYIPSSDISNQITGMYVSDSIKQLRNTDLRDNLMEQLYRIDSVCEYLNVSDLHVNNLIISGAANSGYQIVPIDLESIQPNSSAGIFKGGSRLSNRLSPAEISILNSSKQGLGEFRNRYTPIETSQFLGALTKPDTFQIMAQSTIQSLKDHGYTLVISPKDLQWYILLDLLNNDIPFFSQFSNCIYYGKDISNDKLIARSSL